MALAPKEQRKKIGQIEILQKALPAPLEALSNCLNDIELSWRKKGLLAGLWNDWPAIAGQQLAPHSRPISFQRGILVIGASHPQWLQALIYNRSQLLAAIRARGHTVKGIKIQQYHPSKTKDIEKESIVWSRHPSRIDIHGTEECTICGSPAPSGEISLWGKCSFCRRAELSESN